MPELTLVESVNLALREQMRADDRVVVLGQDIGPTGGVFRATAGLLDEFGDGRVLDCPLSESGYIGASVGMAMYGLVPVPEVQFDSFMYPAFEQIADHVGRYRWRTNGAVGMPIVLRVPFGGGNRAPEHHSDSPEMLMAHLPGLRVVVPSRPRDARAMLVAAIRSPDPVVFFEPKRIYRAGREEVPAEPDLDGVLDTLAVVRPGDDVTLVSYGSCVPLCLEAADTLDAAGISAQVVDLRSLYPLDVDGLVAAVSSTGRAVVVHEAPRTGGVGAEVSALLHERAMLSLEAPVERVAGFDAPFPLAGNEDDYLPDTPRIVAAVRRTLAF